MLDIGTATLKLRDKSGQETTLRVKTSNGFNNPRDKNDRLLHQ